MILHYCYPISSFDILKSRRMTYVASTTPHAMDITFKFTNETPEDGPWMLSGSRPERFIASHQMAELWVNFARTGKPSAVGVPEWPAFNLDARLSMRIDTRREVFCNRFSAELAMWQSIGIQSDVEWKELFLILSH